jgi:hypothetical protein
MKRTIPWRGLGVAAVTVGLLGPPALARQVSDPGQVALRYSEVQRKNAAAMRQYNWKSRLEYQVEGETKVMKLNLVRFDQDGKLEKTEIGGESNVKKKSGLRGRRQKKKMRKTKEKWEEIAEMVNAYTHASAGQMLDFLQTAAFKPGTGVMSGTVRVSGSDYMKPGDGISMWVDRQTEQIVKLEFHTYLQTEETKRVMVNGTVSYKTLAGGHAYPARTEVDLPVEKARVVVENFDHIRQGE